MIIDGEMDAMSAENALFSEITTQMQVNRNSLSFPLSLQSIQCHQRGLSYKEVIVILKRPPGREPVHPSYGFRVSWIYSVG
jgi:hypothetical protein